MPMSPRLLRPRSIGASGVAALRNGLVCYLPMNEDASTGDVTAVDWTGNGNNFTSNNTVPSTTGLFGNGRLFTSANTEWLSAPTNTGMATGENAYTFSLWFRSSAWTGGAGLIARSNGTANQSSFYVSLATANVRSIGLAFFGSAGTQFPNTGNSTHITLNAWHMLWVKKAASAATINMGVYCANGTKFTTTATKASGTWNDGSLDWNIGRFNNATGYLNTTSVDEFCKWSRELTDTEIDLLYNNGAGLNLTSA